MSVSRNVRSPPLSALRDFTSCSGSLAEFLDPKKKHKTHKPPQQMQLNYTSDKKSDYLPYFGPSRFPKEAR